MHKPTQRQMYYKAQQAAAQADALFLELVSTGMTREELQACIDKRPSLWRRYEHWLDKLPTTKKLSTT